MKRTIKNIEYDEDIKQMARCAKALRHPTGLLILKYLDDQSCCFTGNLFEVSPNAQPAVSYHLKELKNAGLIQGELNPPKIKYCINQKNWGKAKMLFFGFFKILLLYITIVYLRYTILTIWKH